MFSAAPVTPSATNSNRRSATSAAAPPTPAPLLPQSSLPLGLTSTVPTTSVTRVAATPATLPRHHGATAALSPQSSNTRTCPSAADVTARRLAATGPLAKAVAVACERSNGVVSYTHRSNNAANITTTTTSNSNAATNNSNNPNINNSAANMLNNSTNTASYTLNTTSNTSSLSSSIRSLLSSPSTPRSLASEMSPTAIKPRLSAYSQKTSQLGFTTTSISRPLGSTVSPTRTPPTSTAIIAAPAAAAVASGVPSVNPPTSTTPVWGWTNRGVPQAVTSGGQTNPTVPPCPSSDPDSHKQSKSTNDGGNSNKSSNDSSNNCKGGDVPTPQTGPLAKVSPSESPPLTSVTFRVSLSTTNGETVRIVGNATGLGSWDITKGVHLTTTDELFPFWYSATPVLIPLQTKVEYKYVIVKTDSPDTVLRWEEKEGNREFVTTGVSMTMEDEGGKSRDLFRLLEERAASPATAQRRSSSSFSAMNSFPVHHSEDSRGMPRAPYSVDRDIADLARRVLMTDAVPAINENDTLVICSFGLPVKAVKMPSGEFQIIKQKSLVMPLLHSLRQKVKQPVRFIGWAGVVAENEAEERKIEALLEPYDCVPVHISKERIASFLTFCRRYLWPIFHNVVFLESRSGQPFDSEQWQDYQAINRQFSDVILKEAHESDLFWVHDYHLLLLPQYITRRIRKANVGLFLHIPFPSSEVFRCLPVREEILRGMLCADLVGFHFFEYARHFLVANKRLLGLDYHFRIGGFIELDYGGRNVLIWVGHVHIQYAELREAIEGSLEMQSQTDFLRASYEGRFVFAAVDRCERLSGILLKLRGFQLFLRNYPYSRTKAVLVQYAYPAVAYVDEGTEFQAEVEQLVEEINSEFSTIIKIGGKPVEHRPVELRICELTADNRHALFQMADCLIDTSIRDGFNLNPFEYICCRKDSPAPMILSEFTGCCRALASAMRVNPWKSEAVSAMFDKAMTTPLEDLTDRFFRDQTYLQKNATLQWAEDFLFDLRRSQKRDHLVYVTWGFGTSYRVLGMDSHFRYLEIDSVIQSFRRAQKRVLFFDHEGTLAPDRRSVTAVPGHETLSAVGTAPSNSVKECLKALCASGCTVVILSGRDRSLLESWFDSIPGIGLCAEHGYYFKVPQITGNRWHSMSKEDDFTWKTMAMNLMSQYVKRTQGAFIENKGSALVFQYRDADPDFGSWQAKELSNYLEELLFVYPVSVVNGKGYVEVKLKGVNKGQAVEAVLKRLSATPHQVDADFVLCIGDDRSDEDMFTMINSLMETPSSWPSAASNFLNQQTSLSGGAPFATVDRFVAPSATASADAAVATASSGTASASCGADDVSSSDSPRSSETRRPASKSFVGDLMKAGVASKHKAMEVSSTPYRTASSAPPSKSFTVTVGKKPSNARFYVNDIEDVSELLEALRLQATRGRCPPQTKSETTWIRKDASGTGLTAGPVVVGH